MTTALSPSLGILIENDSGENIPPFSVVVVTSVQFVPATEDNEAYVVHHVEKYSGQDGNIFITGNTTIGNGEKTKRGIAYSDQFIYVSIDPNEPDPDPGDEWGPSSGKWTLTSGGRGFLAQGYVETGASPKRAMFYRSPVSKVSSSSSQSAACGCCDCFNCIQQTQAVVGGCLSGPNGAPYKFEIDLGGDGNIVYGLHVLTNNESQGCTGEDLSSYEDSGDPCKWYGCPFKAYRSGSSSSIEFGVYQWILDLSVDPVTMTLVFLGGVNVLEA